MRKFFNKFLPTLQSAFFPLLLTFIAGLLAWKSYTPNTFLTGWDTLHPEFNIKHAFEVAIWGAWRSDQGLGAIAGHSHMVELPRLAFLWLSSFVLKLSQLRYAYFFSCLGIGPLGMFFFLKKALPHKRSFTVALGSYIGAVYYLLNLGTLQQFVVPFEMFATLFAFLPWLFLSAQNYLNNGKRSSLLIFALVSILASPSAYAATLWYAFAAVFLLSSGIYAYLSKHKGKLLRRFALLFLVLVATNLYWILPNIYSVLFQSSVISQSQINQLFTPEAFLHNKEFGNFGDVLTNKNHLFDWQVYDFKTNQFVQLLESWKAHLSDSRVNIIPQVFAIFAIIGAAISIFKKDKKGVTFIAPLLICLFFLMNENGPLSGLYNLLRTHISVLEEGLRMPFTKFSILFIFFLSYYIGVFFETVSDILLSTLRLRLIPLLFTTFAFVSLLVLMQPAFKEGIISPFMRQEIPYEYFETFDWFKSHPGRIAQLPLNSLWGWQYNKWGYQGAGFLWFGVENPVLVRDFDRWSAQNETFYNEASRALYSNNINDFENIVEKFNVHYLVLDDSIFDPGAQSPVNTKTFLKNSKVIEEVAKFGEITIYQTPYGEESLSTPSLYAQINADTTYAKEDSVFKEYGAYVSDPNAAWKPFVNLSDISLDKKRETEWVTYTKTINIENESTLTIPDMVRRESVLPVEASVKIDKKSITVKFNLLTPKITVDDNEIKLSPVYMTYPFRVNEKPGYLSVEGFVFDISNISIDSEFHTVGNLYVNTQGKTKIQIFSQNKKVNTSFLSEIKKRSATWCSDGNKEAPLKALLSGIALESEKESLCIGNEVVMPTGGLYETSFITPDGDTSFFCINKPGIDGCVNVVPPKATNIAIGRTTTYQTPLEQGNYWFVFVGQGGLEKTSVATFDDLRLSYYPQLNRTDIEFGNAFDMFSTEQNISVSKAEKISVTFFAGPIIFEDFSLRRGHPTAVNCELEKKGEVTKSFKDEGVEYSAKNGGVSCDYFDYPMLLQSQSYLMTISGVNSYGRSAKFYLQNRLTSHMDFEELLPNGTFSKDYVVEGFEEGQGGYVINLETRAFGEVNSQNFINSIHFSPAPTKFLSEITIGKRSEIMAENKLTIKSQKQFGLITKVTTEGSGVLTSNNAFEKGWVAYSFGNGVLIHIKSNGWANAWGVTTNINSIYIFYLPELLEIGGFISLVVTFTVLLIRRNRLTI